MADMEFLGNVGAGELDHDFLVLVGKRDAIWRAKLQNKGKDTRTVVESGMYKLQWAF